MHLAESKPLESWALHIPRFSMSWVIFVRVWRMKNRKTCAHSQVRWMKFLIVVAQIPILGWNSQPGCLNSQFGSNGELVPCFPFKSWFCLMKILKSAHPKSLAARSRHPVLQHTSLVLAVLHQEGNTKVASRDTTPGPTEATRNWWWSWLPSGI